MEQKNEIIDLAFRLCQSGLIWHPEIGDEVVEKPSLSKLSILVDSNSMTPRELRDRFLWIPTVEQIAFQIEVREGFIYHLGMDDSLKYKTVITKRGNLFEGFGNSIRVSFAWAFEKMLSSKDIFPVS